jgi:hypothetical protein
MPTLSTTYLIPAILLNPAFVLHLINTFVSHLVPPSPPVISHSPHPFMESIGPVPGSTPYWDMHADDALCWRYTAIMVLLQVLAFGRVQDNRLARRERRAAIKAERERMRKVEVECVGEERKVVAKGTGADGAQDPIEEWEGNGHANRKMNGGFTGLNGAVKLPTMGPEKATQREGVDEAESEESLTETSEEEMMI